VRCPFCGSPDSKVVDSRDVDDAIRRRRQCLDPSCAARFTTYERTQSVALFVVKKDGRREEFSREKLLLGLRKACEKRPLSAARVEAMAADIETALYAANVAEVPSRVVGELVMERLREVDPIAYVRFASVYREFRDLEALREELESLASGSRPRSAQLPLISDPEFSSLSVRLHPAAPTTRTRTRRPVRPVQTPTPIPEPAPAPGVQQKRARKAR
jgi:transcriptional repressor NrdR